MNGVDTSMERQLPLWNRHKIKDVCKETLEALGCQMGRFVPVFDRCQ